MVLFSYVKKFKGGVFMKNRALGLCAFVSILTSGIAVNAADVDLSKLGSADDIRFCSSCRLKLSEELKLKKYPYIVDNEFVYDSQSGEFVGLSKVDKALRKAGITDYKIEIKPTDSSDANVLKFNVKTDNTNKNYIPLILSSIGVELEEDAGNESIQKVVATDGYANCYKRAHTGAFQKLNAYYGDKYNVDYEETEDTSSEYINEDTFEVNVCLHATDVTKKDEEEEE